MLRTYAAKNFTPSPIIQPVLHSAGAGHRFVVENDAADFHLWVGPCRGQCQARRAQDWGGLMRFALWAFYAFLLLLPALLALGRKWLIAPIRLKRTHRLKGRPEWEPTTPENLTPETQEFLGSAVTAFRQIGFEVILNARHSCPGRSPIAPG